MKIWLILELLCTTLVWTPTGLVQQDSFCRTPIEGVQLLRDSLCGTRPLWSPLICVTHFKSIQLWDTFNRSSFKGLLLQDSYCGTALELYQWFSFWRIFYAGHLENLVCMTLVGLLLWDSCRIHFAAWTLAVVFFTGLRHFHRNYWQESSKTLCTWCLQVNFSWTLEGHFLHDFCWTVFGGEFLQDSQKSLFGALSLGSFCGTLVDTSTRLFMRLCGFL